MATGQLRLLKSIYLATLRAYDVPVQERMRVKLPKDETMKNAFFFLRCCSISYLTAATLYILSYAPFLHLRSMSWDRDMVYYRSPVFYRPVEWVIARTPLKEPLLEWADVCGVRDYCQVQGFFFANGTENPEEDFHFNIGSD